MMFRGVGITPLIGILDVVKHVHYYILRKCSLCMGDIRMYNWSQSIHGDSPVELSNHNPFVTIDDMHQLIYIVWMYWND